MFASEGALQHLVGTRCIVAHVRLPRSTSSFITGVCLHELVEG